ncbi:MULTISPECIES: bifunctional UDP-N-acetylglucosamine diphosphorylase/glucosamine-1-phosphate N-acetyltransferase GlmU [Brevibacillus]|jgi:bifunctional UDP-N-acetylglucosamine pyrophosphorylase/glucosamine-1-phosphate N-acetyltransferase|uniref:bifunctional UDP-N-acetylglucosamine diphosphorylase/glucosamine-1-phosphate N-acetyltransferase GlmU n=1 Tax=Brevibacillus TaxID=55080 RepID=UPI00046AD741|nr:bifunctional UDP-N-acetylglucosamine diphosphorylase/glucosamine-1-phosphate N-acetyltransferase GlmU [Brevibacillus borstelensis]MBE5395819.1 bifunctional UDP-N-acetylglucosamine diphosphorylase/glucosamine-1-phosphate N-acetyltransferase GlmU [Brevibacillus borstelensis]MCC0566201.1 bifunctional UDP-N-acetylglucosamine diphosphorylase/glucosamine-1-phosphate N-acetyltransferase GlmU [Brevibacillus borstelensis]MCM3560524.1 bifunctional UDP-N-acetylglucosamine diphosphorylase/glucosamine-1-p
MSKIHAVVLAAGQGTRMKSKLYKVLHPVCGKPMVQHVVDTLASMRVEDVVVVVGHGADTVQATLGERVAYALQKEQLGTAHAVQQAASFLQAKEGTTFILYGDVPLLSEETLTALLHFHEDQKAAATVLTAVLPDPTGYGRIVRNDSGEVMEIVEHKDASDEVRAIKEINTGIYCFDNQKLWNALAQVKNDNVQGEYYVTDCIGILRQAGEKVVAFEAADPDETMGVNDRAQLSEAEAYMRKRIAVRHMKNGVSIIDPLSTYIEADVTIGSDTILQPGTYLRRGTTIGSDCVIGPQADLSNTKVADGVTISYSVLVDAKVDEQATVGPFAYVRPGTEIGPQTKIGDFVELKNAKIGKGTKIPHLSYVGDAEIGEGVNIGCGTITVNYDGAVKHKTVVQDGSFIGCNTNLVAPVTVGKNAYVAAGSTINQDVPDDALAIARERQVNKPGYANKLPRKSKKE